jgi:hypothetical protein
VRIGEALLGKLLVFEEYGDTYSEVSGQLLGVLQPDGELVIEQESELHAVLRLTCALTWQGGQVSAVLRLTFDRSPMLRWQVDLEGRGVNYRVEMVFETALPGQVYAGMPFDTVSRQVVDLDLLPMQLESKLSGILIGQRELEEVRTFPFHEYVAISDGASTRGVFARGLHAYQATEEGTVNLPLLRAVEWLAKPDLSGRAGDAGPSFYVPDARCERCVRHELAFACLDGGIEQVRLQALNAIYQNPPLLVEVQSTDRGRASLSAQSAPIERVEPKGESRYAYLREDLPMSSLRLMGGKVLARFFNPTGCPNTFSRPYQETDVSGERLGIITHIAPKRILTVEAPQPPAVAEHASPTLVEVLNPPAWRVGPNQGLPDPVVLEQLKKAIKRLEREMAVADGKASETLGREAYRWQHRAYVVGRELLEMRLSLLLNEIKLGTGGRVSKEYLYNPEEQVAELGYQLNQMRIKRRIYDYVVVMETGQDSHSLDTYGNEP